MSRGCCGPTFEDAQPGREAVQHSMPASAGGTHQVTLKSRRWRVAPCHSCSRERRYQETEMSAWSNSEQVCRILPAARGRIWHRPGLGWSPSVPQARPPLAYPPLAYPRAVNNVVDLRGAGQDAGGIGQLRHAGSHGLRHIQHCTRLHRLPAGGAAVIIVSSCAPGSAQGQGQEQDGGGAAAARHGCRCLK